MSDECRFDGMGYCTAHGFPSTRALCTHAAAALQRCCHVAENSLNEAHRQRGLSEQIWHEEHAKLKARVRELEGEIQWVLDKLKTMRTYHPPTDGRMRQEEIRGWLHVLCADHDLLQEVLPEFDARGRNLSRAEATVERMQEALIDRRSGRPQCRYCYEYLDKPKPEHTDTCWAAAALAKEIEDW